jgi:hypothetical protein
MYERATRNRNAEGKTLGKEVGDSSTVEAGADKGSHRQITSRRALLSPWRAPGSR